MRTRSRKEKILEWNSQKEKQKDFIVQTKQIVFIRHAHSLGWFIYFNFIIIKFNFYLFWNEGQAASKNKRNFSDELIDCDLSSLGHQQAANLANEFENRISNNEIIHPDLICTSPLTRALKTALSIFNKSDRKIIIHPSLAELGYLKKPIPENRGWFCILSYIYKLTDYLNTKI